MTVYVDNMHEVRLGQYRRMYMSHMIADEDDELHAMADKIGVKRKWHQGDHYDICKSKRALAVKYGAVQITMRQLAMMAAMKRITGELGDPETAEQKWKEHRRKSIELRGSDYEGI